MANFFEEAAGEAKRVPWWGWVLGGGAVLLFGSHLLNKSNSATGTAAADASGTSGDGGLGGSVGDIGTAGPPVTSGGAPDTGSTGTGDSSGSGTVTPQPQPQPAPAPAPAPAPKPAPAPAPAPAYRTYTVRSGDTLSEIGSRYHVDWQTIYALNAGTIEATARGHGFGSSDHGHWIFPGEVLKIPA